MQLELELETNHRPVLDGAFCGPSILCLLSERLRWAAALSCVWCAVLNSHWATNQVFTRMDASFSVDHIDCSEADQ
ncbi:hypothetical protein PHLGIDRAFT_286413 [Phlebiopsis gigantea 11061_1 CR5-6]|uniref:Uncharacterized protein n=1 Tax=Phlebiopsis gigantea (strain 11061_1 CR5-6) TaxID=745531 RepID=A0A0C3S0P4_PHLG1|nr:hypothetical protein PHLGIDRAFT_286413 [Phlebiopsis gigantea 11061_1 CR5-6]